MPPFVGRVVGVGFLLLGAASLVLEVLLLRSDLALEILIDEVRQQNVGALVAVPWQVHLAHALVGSAIWIVGGLVLALGQIWPRGPLLAWQMLTFVLYVLYGSVTDKLFGWIALAVAIGVLFAVRRS